MEYREAVDALYARMPGKMGPMEYTRLVSDELVRWREVIRLANIRVE